MLDSTSKDARNWDNVVIFIIITQCEEKNIALFSFNFKTENNL